MISSRFVSHRTKMEALRERGNEVVMVATSCASRFVRIGRQLSSVALTLFSK